MALPSKNVIYVFTACAILLIGLGVSTRILSDEKQSGDLAAEEIREKAYLAVENAILLQSDNAIDELLDSGSEGGNATTSSSTEPLSATDTFSRTVLDGYISAKYNKNTLTEADIETMVAEILSGPVASQRPRIYARQDLKIFTSTPAELHFYGNALVKAFENNLSPDVGREIYLVEDVLESQDEKKTAKLYAVAQYFQKMIDATLALKTPDVVAGSALEYINSLSALKLAIENMAKVLSDPILAVKGINEREGYAEAAIQNMQSIGLILKRHGVIYVEGELGAELLSGI